MTSGVRRGPACLSTLVNDSWTTRYTVSPSGRGPAAVGAEDDQLDRHAGPADQLGEVAATPGAGAIVRVVGLRAAAAQHGRPSGASR